MAEAEAVAAIAAYQRTLRQAREAQAEVRPVLLTQAQTSPAQSMGPGPASSLGTQILEVSSKPSYTKNLKRKKKHSCFWIIN